ncbi:MAG: helix-hairpin-helix domain-containing protein [Bdellovibrionota bacterium]
MKNVVRISVLILSASLAPATWAQDFPAGEGRETLKKVCTQCHDIDSLPRLRYTRSDWANLVFSMKDMGADATGAELDQIIDYLTKNFGKGEDAVKKTNVNSASAKEIEAALGFTTKESEAIVLYRMKNGNYKDLDTMKKVEGVDAAKVQSAKDKIEF